MNTPIFVVSWILWTLCLIAEAGLGLFRLFPRTDLEASTMEAAQSNSWLFQTVMIVTLFLATGFWLLQRFLLQKPSSGVARFWLWPATFLLYALMAFALAVGTTPYIGIGPTDQLSLWALGCGAALLVLTLPAWHPQNTQPPGLDFQNSGGRPTTST